MHYVQVAQRLSVSKWTAYDMMQRLVKDGFVRASYAVGTPGVRGRSQVLFEPTGSGLNLLTGLLAGVLLVKDVFQKAPELEHMVARFSQQVSLLGDSSREDLMDFARLVVGNPGRA